MKSYRVIAEGGLDLWDDLKAKSLGTVRCLTDDTEISLGLLIKNADGEVRIGTITPTRPASLETQELGRRHRTQVLSIQSHRIKRLVTVS